MKTYLIGIDGGGTNTRAALSDTAGRLLAVGQSTSSNLQHAGHQGVQTAIDTAVANAFQLAGLPRQAAAAIFLGLAGIVRPADRQIIRDIARELNLAPQIDAGHDVRIAHTGGLDGRPGIALIAGTGSSCYGKNENNETLLVGGWGYLADDRGSAGNIGLNALNLAVRQADQRLPGTAIRDAIFSKLNITDPRDFLHRVHIENGGLTRGQIAALCPLVCQLAAHGDEHSRQLLRQAAADLADLISTTARRLQITAPEIVLAGGLAHSPDFNPLLEKTIRDKLPSGKLHAPENPPHIGALIEAARLAQIPDFKIQSSR